MTVTELKARLKAVPETAAPESWRVRLHRALSWLDRAGQVQATDPDTGFILLWVALNAAYAREFGDEEPERDRLRQFIATLLELDGQRQLHGLLFRQFSGSIRTLIDNRYVFQPFWKALREHDASERWKERHEAGRKAALAAITGGDTATLLAIVFDRLYVLRNQLVHGGATWNSQVNRQQVRDGVDILSSLVPLVIELMLAQPDRDFGEICYPVVA